MMTHWEKWLVGFSHVSSLDVSDITSHLHFHASKFIFLTADIIGQAQIATPVATSITAMAASIHKQY